ncbi:hypothetical protein B5E80_18860 [Flavonifractor sp. An135]|nr:hypothetical protein B5E80_18860 [Flavonifractor sp. An135]
MSKQCVDCHFKGKGYCKNCVYGPFPFTNADRIRSMSDEELEEFFGRVARTAGCPPPNQMDCMDDCEKCWDIYLRKSAEED